MVELHDLIQIQDAEESSSKGVLDKLAAVKRVVPKHHRRAVKNVVKQGASLTWTGAKSLGSAAWYGSTSLIVLVLPLVIAIGLDEQQQALVKAAESTTGGSLYPTAALQGQPQQ